MNYWTRLALYCCGQQQHLELSLARQNQPFHLSPVRFLLPRLCQDNFFILSLAEHDWNSLEQDRGSFPTPFVQPQRILLGCATGICWDRTGYPHTGTSPLIPSTSLITKQHLFVLKHSQDIFILERGCWPPVLSSEKKSQKLCNRRDHSNTWPTEWKIPPMIKDYFCANHNDSTRWLLPWELLLPDPCCRSIPVRTVSLSLLPGLFPTRNFTFY